MVCDVFFLVIFISCFSSTFSVVKKLDVSFFTRFSSSCLLVLGCVVYIVVDGGMTAATTASASSPPPPATAGRPKNVSWTRRC